MIYLALALIALGLLVLIISLSTKNNKVSDNEKQNLEKPKKVYTYTNEPTPKDEIPDMNQEIPEISERIIEKNEINRMNDELPQTLPDSPATHQDNVFFYEDNSNLVDYSNDTGTIDSTLEEYKKIKLIGKGTLLLEKQGLSFHIGKKFRRFDFHSVAKLISGPDYISVITRSGPIKLFIIKHNSNFIANITAAYHTNKNQ